MTVTACFELLGDLMKSNDPESAEIVDSAMELIRNLENSSESDRWEALGTELLNNAKTAQTNQIASYYTLVGCACLGHSVDLHRNNPQ